MSLFPFPFVPSLSPLPLALSLSKDAFRRDVHFDKLSANGSSRREPV